MGSRATSTATAGLLALGLVLAGCGGADRATAPAGREPSPADALRVEVDPGDGGPTSTWTLTCSPPGGTHPDPAGACADLAAAVAPFAPPDPDAFCTEVYGGPQVARVTGTWRGRAVETTYDRVNGCAISRWDATGRLLPAAAPTALQPPS